MGIPGQNDIWVLALKLGTKNTIREKVVGSPSLNHVEFYESMFTHGLSVHQKGFQLRINQLVVWFVHVRVSY